MTTAGKRLRIALINQDLTRAKFASAVGLRESTLGNIIRGGRCSLKTRWKITQFLQVSIWDGIPVEARHIFRKDTTIEFVDSPELASQCAKEFKGKVRVLGCAVTFLEDTPATFFLNDGDAVGQTGDHS
jgi:transcriptional regulator with XRE-family HTH domain